MGGVHLNAVGKNWLHFQKRVSQMNNELLDIESNKLFFVLLNVFDSLQSTHWSTICKSSVQIKCN